MNMLTIGESLWEYAPVVMCTANVVSISLFLSISDSFETDDDSDEDIAEGVSSKDIVKAKVKKDLNATW